MLPGASHRVQPTVLGMTDSRDCPACQRSGLGPERSGEEACPRCRSQAYLPKAVPREPQDFQSVVGPLASAVEFDVAGETFQLYLSKRE